MKIIPATITVRDLFDGYKDSGDAGVVGYGGKLNIRPPYQREFVYKPKDEVAVINSVRQGFPLNSIFWVVNDDGTFEVLDGQQRIVSLCRYLSNDFGVEAKFFSNLQSDEKDGILNYELAIYQCSGTDSDKLKWFEVINFAGEKLTKQELLNAVYTGPWLTDAKKKFSKPNCPAYAIGADYIRGEVLRQHYLQTALKWANDGDVAGYMAAHQLDANADALWANFKSTIEWTKQTFPNVRKEMKSVNWGALYAAYGSKPLNPSTLEADIVRLMADYDVTNKKGVYHYVLSGDEHHLNIRRFNDAERRTAFTKQRGVCAKCGDTFKIEQMEADHVVPWSQGGKTEPSNCQMLCKTCNGRKSNK